MLCDINERSLATRLMQEGVSIKSRFSEETEEVVVSQTTFAAQRIVIATLPDVIGAQSPSHVSRRVSAGNAHLPGVINERETTLIFVYGNALRNHATNGSGCDLATFLAQPVLP